jgi:hypothetical protein
LPFAEGSFAFAQDFGSGLKRPLNASTWAQGVTGSNPVAPTNQIRPYYFKGLQAYSSRTFELI